MKGRLYDPKLRRFITPDPFVTDPFNPQGLNRYSYVQNNPLTYTDPSGFDVSNDPTQDASGRSGYGNGVGASTPLQISIDSNGNIQIVAPTPTREGPSPTPGTQPGTGGTESDGPCAARPSTPQPATNQAQGGTQTETPDAPAPASDTSGGTHGESPPPQSIGTTPNGPAGSETSQASSSQSAGPVCTTASASATPQAPSQSTWNSAQSGNPGLWPWNGPPSSANTSLSEREQIQRIMFGFGYAGAVAIAFHVGRVGAVELMVPETLLPAVPEILLPPARGARCDGIGTDGAQTGANRGDVAPAQTA